MLKQHQTDGNLWIRSIECLKLSYLILSYLNTKPTVKTKEGTFHPPSLWTSLTKHFTCRNRTSHSYSVGIAIDRQSSSVIISVMNQLNIKCWPVGIGLNYIKMLTCRNRLNIKMLTCRNRSNIKMLTCRNRVQLYQNVDL